MESPSTGYEAAWTESYNQFNKPVEVYEDIGGITTIFCSVTANRSNISDQDILHLPPQSTSTPASVDAGWGESILATYIEN